MAERRVKIIMEEGGLTVEQYLKQRLGLSGRQISSLKFRPEGIRVNGVRQRVKRELQKGDCLELLLESRKPDEEETGRIGNGLPDPWKDGAGRYAGPEIPVLYEDADLIAVAKPSGLVCHPSHGHYGDTLADWAAARAGERGEDWNVRIVGRLDKDTSGVVVAAKNAETAALLSRQREQGRMKKTYLALTEGRPEPACGCIDLPIGKEEDSLMKMRTEESGRPARTWYRVLETKDGISLLLLNLEHGRTHQIRVHMASAGYPLCGDPIYGGGSCGSGAPRGGRQEKSCTRLHAWQLELAQPFTGERLRITAPPPEWCAGFSSLRVFDKMEMLY